MTKKSFLQNILTDDRAPVVILTGLGLAAYAGTAAFPFVHDDFPLVVNNLLLQNWDWRAVFFRQTDFGFHGDLSRPYYRPILDVINGMVAAIFGVKPAAFHALNIILHILNGLLLFRILRTILERFGLERMPAHTTALMTAMLFVIHPVQTQAVACVSGISNLAAAFFCLSAFQLYLQIDGVSGLRRQVGFAGMSVMFILALFCKEQALVFPGLLLMYQWFAFRQSKHKDPWPPMIRLGALCLILIAVYVIWKKLFAGVLTFPIDSTAGGMLRISAIPHILLTNFRVLFFPYDLHYFRSLDMLADHIWPTAALSCVLAGIVYGLKYLQSPERRAVLFGLGWFVIAQATTLQIVPLFWEYSHMSVAEHFLYLPSVGIFLVICVFVRAVYRRLLSQAQIIMRIAVVLILGFLFVLTLHQNQYWASETAVFERAVRFEPQLGRLQHILAQVYFHQQRYADSIRADQAAVDIMARYESVAVGESAKLYYRLIRSDAMMSLGLAHRMLNDIPSAVNWMRQAVVLQPDNAGNHSTLGVMYAEQGDFENALRHMRRAVELAPDHADYLRNIGVLLSVNGRTEEARSYFEKILELSPSDEQARRFLEGIQP